MRRGLSWIAVAGLVLGAACSLGTWREEARPSILVVLVDALRPDHLGCYGYGRPTSPEIDRLAARSVRFSQAVAVSSWTKPSVPSLFTSLYPSQHGVLEGSARGGPRAAESDVLPEEARTLAEALRERGYRTAAFVHNAHLRPAFGLAQGFDEYLDSDESAPAMIRRVLAWMDGERSETGTSPFFVYLHVLDVHWPYEPPPEAARALGAEAGERPDDYALREAVNRGLVRLSPEEVERIVLRYDAEIRGVDAALGELLDGLEERGLLERMVVAFTSDHGEAFLEHGTLGHGADLYEESLRVPLILKLPGARGAGRVVAERVTTLDLMPTLLELAGVAPVEAGAAAGRSLTRFLDERGRGEATPSFAEVRHGRRARQAVVRGGWKLIRTVRGRAGASAARPPEGAGSLEALIGRRLEVQGMRLAGGLFVASEIEEKPADDEDDEVTGLLESLDPMQRTARVAGFVVDLRKAAFLAADRRTIAPAAVGPGRYVKLDGKALGPDQFVVEKLRMLEGEAETEIEGIVRRVRPGPGRSVTIEMAGLRVSARKSDLDEAIAGRQSADRPEALASGTASKTRIELYDLARDPGERMDLAAREPARAAALLADLEAWGREVSARALPRAGRVALDDETMARLRALGYVQ